jgi:hypothetical protein
MQSKQQQTLTRSARDLFCPSKHFFDSTTCSKGKLPVKGFSPFFSKIPFPVKVV